MGLKQDAIRKYRNTSLGKRAIVQDAYKGGDQIGGSRITFNLEGAVESQKDAYSLGVHGVH